MAGEESEQLPTAPPAVDEQIQLTGEFTEAPKLDNQVQPAQTDSATPATTTEIIPWTPDTARAITQSAFNIPAVIYGEHLIRTPVQVEPVVMPLYELGKKYGLQSFPWITEIAFVCAVGMVAGSMYRDHQEYLKQHGKTEDAPQAAKEAEKPQEAAGTFEQAVDKI